MRSRGFSLVEVMIAILLLTIGLLALAQLMAVATRTNQLSGRQTSAAALAKAQVERLKGVPFYLSFTPFGRIVNPSLAAGGGDLNSNVEGYHLFFDPDGRVVQNQALYVVRWRIEDIATPANPLPWTETLKSKPQVVLAMKRITVRCLPAAEAGNQFRRIGDAILVSYRTANIG